MLGVTNLSWTIFSHNTANRMKMVPSFFGLSLMQATTEMNIKALQQILHCKD